MTMDDGERGASARALEFLRQARPVRGLSAGAVDRIERNLAAPTTSTLRPRALRFALAGAVVAVLVGGFAAAHGGWRKLPYLGGLFAAGVSGSSATPEAASKPALPSPKAGVEARGELALPSPASPSAQAPGETAPAIRGTAAPRETRHERSAMHRGRGEKGDSRPVLEQGDDAILAESRSFAAAVEHWHRDQDGDAALAALDAHARRFPAGRLLTEAQMLRAEILLAGGREQESLAVLDRMKLAGSPRARELLTVRGELRVKLGRCADGRRDLDQVLRQGDGDAFAKRAAQALSRCP